MDTIVIQPTSRLKDAHKIVEKIKAGVPLWSVAVDIGGSHVTAAAVDLGTGTIREESRISLFVDSGGDADLILDLWARALTHAFSNGGDTTHYLGCGIAIPGPFDYNGGTCYMKGVAKYESLFGINIRKSLKLILGWNKNRPILFCNDAVCFILGEHWRGAAQGKDSALAITLGTGLGSVFLHNGEVIEGGEGAPPNGVLFHVPWRGVTGDEYFSSRGIVKLFKDRTGNQVDGVVEIAKMALTDESARETFLLLGSELAAFLTPWLRSMKCEVLVVGGNITRAWEWFGPTLAKEIKTELPDIGVFPTTLFEDGALLGAALLPLKFEEP